MSKEAPAVNISEFIESVHQKATELGPSNGDETTDLSQVTTFNLWPSELKALSKHLKQAPTFIGLVTLVQAQEIERQGFAFHPTTGEKLTVFSYRIGSRPVV